MFLSVFLSIVLHCTHCVSRHSIVGLVLCLCDRVVSLWNSGDGCVWGRRACGVCCPLSTLYVLRCVFQWGVCVVLLCCVVGCGMAVRCEGCEGCEVSLLVFLFFVFLFLFLFVLVFGVVRAQLCEHARYPRTPLRLLLLCSLFSSLLRPAFLRAPLFLLLEWRCVIHHVLECCVGMTAMGSLSLSSSFFW